MGKPIGPETIFIAKHLDQSNEQLLELAKLAKVRLSLKQIGRTRFRLKRKGISKPTELSSLPAPRVKKKAVTALVLPKQQHELAFEDTVEDPKVTMLRKLIMELGLDNVRPVIRSFEEIHNRLS